MILLPVATAAVVGGDLMPPSCPLDLDGLRTGTVPAVGLAIVLAVGVADLRSGGRGLSAVGRLCNPYTLAVSFLFPVMAVGLLWTPHSSYGPQDACGSFDSGMLRVGLGGFTVICTGPMRGRSRLRSDLYDGVPLILLMRLWI
jgi:hypothetical protein